MDKKIAIIGAEIGKAKIVQALAKDGYTDVQIVTIDELKEQQNPFENKPVFTVSSYDKAMLEAFNGKEFVCKGRHEYREIQTQEGSFIKSEWICQCGRKLSD